MTIPTVRHPAIAIEDLSLSPDWLGGDGFRSQVFNALSQCFPVGEGYFIAAANQALPLLEREEDRALVHAFIGQEVSHSTLHRRLNRRLRQTGLRNLVEPVVAWRIRLSRALSPRTHLAITMAYEHFTAVFAQLLLGHPQWLEGCEPAMRLLWQWHAVEEWEHRAVAFDLYHRLGGGRKQRLGWFLYVSLLFCLDLTLQTMLNLLLSGLWRKPATWRQAARFLLGREDLPRLLPPLWRHYLRLDFHPAQGGESALVDAWLAEHAALF
ncbi:putative metal-dependent hydrolase [mine drainage metagenome]|uniref:Putative metal-dependent hydrolase n=1 Tax=mine drainage metagenome TaxID=410659 RepID=A0A1J5TA75_9ZZZZ